MHREPLPRDIIQIPGSDAPERVVNVSAEVLTLAPLRGEETRTIERPARESIRLIGIAAPGRKRRAYPADNVRPRVMYGSSGIDPADLF